MHHFSRALFSLYVSTSLRGISGVRRRAFDFLSTKRRTRQTVDIRSHIACKGHHGEAQNWLTSTLIVLAKENSHHLNVEREAVPGIDHESNRFPPRIRGMHLPNPESRHQYYVFCVLTLYLFKDPRSHLILNSTPWNTSGTGAQSSLRRIRREWTKILLGPA